MLLFFALFAIATAQFSARFQDVCPPGQRWVGCPPGAMCIMAGSCQPVRQSDDEDPPRRVGQPRMGRVMGMRPRPPIMGMRPMTMGMPAPIRTTRRPQIMGMVAPEFRTTRRPQIMGMVAPEFRTTRTRRIMGMLPFTRRPRCPNGTRWSNAKGHCTRVQTSGDSVRRCPPGHTWVPCPRGVKCIRAGACQRSRGRPGMPMD